MIRYTFNSFCCCSLQRRWRWKSCSKLCSLHRKLLRSDKQQQRVGGAVKEVLDSNPGARVKGNVLTAWCDTHTHTATYRHTYTHRESLKDLGISEGPWTLDSSNALYTNAVSIFSTAGQVLLFNFETRAKEKHTHTYGMESTKFRAAQKQHVSTKLCPTLFGVLLEIELDFIWQQAEQSPIHLRCKKLLGWDRDLQ